MRRRRHYSQEAAEVSFKRMRSLRRASGEISKNYRGRKPRRRRGVSMVEERDE